jgi:hypothetical protein
LSRDYRKALEVEGPSATCGGCRFTSALKGTWSVEDGRLVWRADPDPQPGRGPDLERCGESDRCPPGGFEYITVDGEDLSAEDAAMLRASAADARQREWGS